MGVAGGLFQRVNHIGNEAKVVEKDGMIIGFQAKYFSSGINADDIISSMTVAKEANSRQTHYYIYSNKALGNSKLRKKAKKQILFSINRWIRAS